MSNKFSNNKGITKEKMDDKEIPNINLYIDDRGKIRKASSGRYQSEAPRRFGWILKSSNGRAKEILDDPDHSRDRDQWSIIRSAK